MGASKICRADWKWTPEALQAGHYVEAHLPHPFDPDRLQPLLEFVLARHPDQEWALPAPIFDRIVGGRGPKTKTSPDG